MEDVVVVSDKLLLQKVVFPCKTFLTSDINRAEFKGNGSTTDLSINFRQNDDSSIFAQEMTVRPKSNTEKIMSKCLTWFLFCGCRRTQYIPEYGEFYKNVGILLGGCLTVKN